MRAFSSFLRSPKFGWLLALGWICLATPERLLAQEAAVTAAIASRGSDIDDALRSSLNLSALGLEGLDPGQAVEQIRVDRDRLNAVLRAFGLYEGRVDVLVNEQPFYPDRQQAVLDLQSALREGHVHVLFVPTFGPVYRIRSVRVIALPNGEAPTLIDAEGRIADQESGKLATAETLAKIESAWLWRQREAGRALAAAVTRSVSPHADSHAVDVTLGVDEGPQVKLGPVRFEGLQRIDPDSLEQYVPFRSGDPYQPALIEHVRTALQHLPFFQSVRVDLARAPDVSGLLPVTITVVEKPPGTQRLFLSGLMGTIVFGLSAAMLVLSQLAGASALPFWERHSRQVSTATWILLIASALVGLQRLLYLGNA